MKQSETRGGKLTKLGWVTHLTTSLNNNNNCYNNKNKFVKVGGCYLTQMVTRGYLELVLV